MIGKAIYSTTAFNLKERTGVDISKNPSTSKAKINDMEPALPHVFEKLPPVFSPEYVNNVDVRYFDCDFFGHVTHVKYIEWGIETLPLDFLRKHRLYEMEIDFKKESSLGDKLIVKTGVGSEKNTFIHSITGEEGGRELIRMKSIWK
jgi:acyl-ACP thioesterase